MKETRVQISQLQQTMKRLQSQIASVKDQVRLRPSPLTPRSPNGFVPQPSPALGFPLAS